MRGLITSRCALAVVALALSTTLAIAGADLSDGLLLETVAAHRFALIERGDLIPREDGPVRIWVARIHPAASNASIDWFSPGLDGRHPLLDGKYRYDAYKSAILEWLAGSRSPEAEGLIDVARELLRDVTEEMTFAAAAAVLRRRAEVLPADERDSLVQSLEDLEPWGDERAVGASLTNGTFEVLVASALHHGRVLARIATASALVENSVLEDDPAFTGAYDAATLSLKRRRSRMRLAIKDKIRFHANNRSDESLRESRVALIPIVTSETAYASFEAASHARLGIDHTLEAKPPATIAEFLRLESVLVLLTTFERVLFGGERFEAVCDPASAGADVWRLRAYLGRYALSLLEEIYDAYGADFFSEQLRWEVAPGVHAEFRERVSMRRAALDDALRACAALSLATVASGSVGAAADVGDLARFVKWISGSFSSGEQAAADSSYFDIRLQHAPIWKERTDATWLYVEQAVAAHVDRPYRQRIYRVVEADGEIVSEVYTLPVPEAFIGAWRQPSRFDILEPDSLRERAGCAVHLRWTGAAFEGGTVGKGCASSLRGASYATSRVQLYEDRIETWDRGFDADDVQVWGAEKSGYIFRKLRRPSDP